MKTPRTHSIGRFAAVAVMSAGLLAGSVAPATATGNAGHKSPADYVALGDSYAAGFGAGAYFPDDPCVRSPLGLPGLLDEKKKIELTFNATCIGAKAAADFTDLVPDLPEQLAGLLAGGGIGAETDLVTVSAGGNDVNFGAVAFVCATQTIQTCAGTITFAENQARTTVSDSLNALYGSVRAAAPNAKVVVTGYPYLFSPEFGVELPVSNHLGSGVLSTEAQTLFNAGTDTLNGVIKAAAKDNGLHYVDVTKRFSGHGIGSRDPWINFTGLAALDDLHPNAEGYEKGYFRSVRSEVSFGQLWR